MESYAPQKAADYQRLILFCYCFCDTVVPGQVMLHSGAGSTTTEHNGLNAKPWCFAFSSFWAWGRCWRVFWLTI